MFYYNLYEVLRNEKGEVKDLVFKSSYDFINDIPTNYRSIINDSLTSFKKIKTYTSYKKTKEEEVKHFKEYTIFKDIEED